MNFLCTLLLFLNLSGCKEKSPDKLPVPSPDPVEVILPPTGPGDSQPVIEPVIVEEPAPTPAPSVPPSEVVVPNLATTFKVNVIFGGNPTAAQKEKYAKAIEVLKKNIASKEFKARVLAHKYDGKSGFASSSETPLQVYNKLLSGAEKLSPQVDNELDLEARFYYANNSTVGYTYPNVKYIMINTKFFNSYTPTSVARNLLHEYLHKLGYGHDSAATARRPYSVPYALGGMVRTL